MRAPLLLLAVAAVTAACSAQPERQAAPPARGGMSGVSPTPSPVPTTSPASSPSAAAPAPTPVVLRGDGDLHDVPGGSAVSGPGRATSYAVAVEGGLGVDGPAFAREVDRVLADPRSWGGSGLWALRRVPGGEVAFRVVLASPETTDRLCAPLQTNGHLSCRNGPLVVLNAQRWLTGADSYAGHLPRYREYLVNHEVGHALGHGHVPCPGPGLPAPVMLQQTQGLDGCTRNPWPHP